LAEQPRRRRGAAQPYDAVANKPQQSSVGFGIKIGRHWLEAGGWTSAVDDEYCRPAFEAIDQRAQIGLGFGSAGSLHPGENRFL
jgi:hypothetical protein